MKHAHKICDLRRESEATFWELGINLTEFRSIIIIYIYMNINIEDIIRLLYDFSEIRPWDGFCCFARLLVRPPLALVGDGHPNSHATVVNAG